jgi:hypothetical protein
MGLFTKSRNADLFNNKKTGALAPVFFDIEV